MHFLWFYPILFGEMHVSFYCRSCGNVNTTLGMERWSYNIDTAIHWATPGDDDHKVRHQVSIMTAPNTDRFSKFISLALCSKFAIK